MRVYGFVITDLRITKDGTLCWKVPSIHRACRNMSDLEDYVTAACLVIFDCRDDAKGRPRDEKIYLRRKLLPSVR